MNARIGIAAVVAAASVVGLVGSFGVAIASPRTGYQASHQCPKAEEDPYCGDRPQRVRYPDGYKPKTGPSRYLPRFGPGVL